MCNVTLKMAELPAETCRWKYHNKNTSVELSAFCWFLIHVIQISVRNLERIKSRFEVINSGLVEGYSLLICDALSLGECFPKCTLFFFIALLWKWTQYNLPKRRKTLTQRHCLAFQKPWVFFNSKKQKIFNTKLRPSIIQIFVYLLPAVYFEADNSVTNGKELRLTIDRLCRVFW